jgi:hypothetical protein
LCRSLELLAQRPGVVNVFRDNIFLRPLVELLRVAIAVLKGFNDTTKHCLQ